MANYHVGCGLAGIYAGTVKKNGLEWLNKSDATQEALCAVSQYLLSNRKEFHFQLNGEWYVMRVSEKEEAEG